MHAYMVVDLVQNRLLVPLYSSPSNKQHHNASSAHWQARPCSDTAFHSGWNPVHRSHRPKGELTGIRCVVKKISCVVPKPIAIFFFPKAFTTGCTKEACAFRDAKQDNIAFQGTGSDELEVIGISRGKLRPSLGSFSDPDLRCGGKADSLCQRAQAQLSNLERCGRLGEESLSGRQGCVRPDRWYVPFTAPSQLLISAQVGRPSSSARMARSRMYATRWWTGSKCFVRRYNPCPRTHSRLFVSSHTKMVEKQLKLNATPTSTSTAAAPSAS